MYMKEMYSVKRAEMAAKGGSEGVNLIGAMIRAANGTTNGLLLCLSWLGSRFPAPYSARAR
jgi:hypothetical protein